MREGLWNGPLDFPYPGMGHRVAGGALSQINRKQMSHCIVSDLYSELFPTVQLFRFLNMFPQLFFISDTRSTGVIDYSLSFSQNLCESSDSRVAHSRVRESQVAYSRALTSYFKINSEHVFPKNT